MNKIKRIGVFTSGGDAPGMNAAIRAVVRTGLYNGLEIYGIQSGYEGMINGKIKVLEHKNVANIIQRGGTILKTARSIEFMTEEGREKAYKNLIKHKIDALVAIGGNGTFTGAMIFSQKYNFPIVGLPGTIDNDLYGTDYTIGFDTAINTAVEAVDKIRDTANSHDRVFFIEVMGRHSGYIALHTGIASGAGNILVPEKQNSIADLLVTLKRGSKRGKLFSLVIVAEGNTTGNAHEIADKVKIEIPNTDIKVTVIGHLQRGGSPTARDRVLASRLGYAAINCLKEGKHGHAIGVINDLISYTSFEDSITKQKVLNNDLVAMAQILAM